MFRKYFSNILRCRFSLFLSQILRPASWCVCMICVSVIAFHPEQLRAVRGEEICHKMFQMEICFYVVSEWQPRKHRWIYCNSVKIQIAESLYSVSKHQGFRREVWFCSQAEQSKPTILRGRSHRWYKQNSLISLKYFSMFFISKVDCRNIASTHWLLKEKNELNRANKAEAKLLCISDCLVFGMWTKCFRL